jgi:hypothetical protein
VVFLGINKSAVEDEGYVGSAGGSVQDVSRDSLIFKGIGGNRRKVSLITARTVTNWLSIGMPLGLIGARTIFQVLGIVIG